MSFNYQYGGNGQQGQQFPGQQPQQSFGGYQQQPTGLGYQQTGFPQQQQQQQSFGSFQQNQPSFGGVPSSTTDQQQFGQTAPTSNGAPAYATNIDQLSFLTPQDQQKFKELFNSSTNNVSISPENARGILMKSNLGPSQLARIWDLSDLNKSGDLLFPEFALALHLCNFALKGNELPYVLDSRTKEEVTGLVDKINFSIPEDVNAIGQDAPVLQPNITTSNIFTQPQQQPQQTQPFQQTQGTYPQTSTLTSQPTGFGFGNSLPSQPTGFQSQSQPQPQQSGLQSQVTGFQPQSQSFQHLNTNSTGFQQSNQQTSSSFQPLQPTQTSNNPISTPSLNQQPTGFQNQSTSGLTQQPTGFQNQSTTGLTQQPTGFQNQSTTGLTQQPTGLIPLKTQGTGAAPSLQQQPTGLVPLNTQQTGTAGNTLAHQQTGGQPLQQQPTGLVPLQGQNTGGQPLKQQPTGLIPIKNQNTGGAPLTQQPTGLVPLRNQQTGSAPISAPIQQTPTGGAPLTQQPTGLVPLTTTATGSVALQTQLTGPAPLQSQRTGFGNFEPLRQQKTGVGQNSLFLQNLLQQSQQQQQQQQQQMFSSNSLNYTTETISPQEKQLFNRIFQNYDTNKKGLLTADVSAEIFRKSGLNRSELEQVWDLVTRPNQSHLDKESFQTGMWLIYKRLNGFELPDFLPESLKPQSIRILDDVKNQLKINPNSKNSKKSSHSKIDGTRFKNNDDEFALSSSRNRRRTTKANNGESGSVQNKPKENLSIDEIKKRIREKKILLDAFDATGSDLKEKEVDYEKEDQEAILRLKQEILSLPNTNSVGDDKTSQLKQKFNGLTSQVPVLINQISSIDNEITRLKLDLYKVKNPSFVIGSGPNGEVTEADRRKAKSKALLAAKMAKLTGKPIDPEVENLSNEQGKLDEEALKIQQENKKNQQIIRDVESSIKEISSNVLNSFSSKNDQDGYKKWELGIGVTPEVQELIKSFRVNDLSNKFTRSLQLDSSPSPAPTSQYSSPSIPQASVQSPVVASPSPTPTTNTVSPTPTSGSANYKTPEERKAYIREQAKKKMNERLAKFGINRSSSQSSPSVSKPASPALPASQPIPQSQQYQPSSEPQLQAEIHQPSQPPQPVAEHQYQQSIQSQGPPQDEESSDDDDEVEFQRMEEIRRLKRLERDQRLAQIDTEDTNPTETSSTIPEPVPDPVPTTEVPSETEQPRKYHDSNPFAFK
ncbi:Actin cytoskeleton-regulatory complex protein [Wickerhamomyces ciferrii]|uniref:Actin cytoskeleton-regulatory complex protein PAN1 n=1 Tax=Wickerhamomyces ciferrii (strain ATCC 14091 / BCRC 22168 / CBS 111 / JCM 3599 / NBRC 0793 / NRRL Y-1031 F-60-10) TaxID=1206466 RepID=K0KN25_WICCF|nr:Actin cytoskeleton-regulatory complex protein [Wickerhamomyces ciferrii]CCH44371.1 Actin cytoskeleton-regulatory complex protein [Wickerhamomyces ciferrii]